MIESVILTVRSNPAGWSVNLSERQEGARGFSKSSTTYRGLTSAELLDVVAEELKIRLEGGSQTALF